MKTYSQKDKVFGKRDAQNAISSTLIKRRKNKDAKSEEAVCRKN